MHRNPNVRPTLAERLQAFAESLVPLLAALALTACAADFPGTAAESHSTPTTRSQP